MGVVFEAGVRNRVYARSYFLIVLLLLAAPLNALAHARMVRSSPTPGDVAQPPGKVELWFNEMLDGHFNSIEVFPAAQLNARPRASLTHGDPKVDAVDRTHLSVMLKPMVPGDYFVEWRVLSLDGHSAPGRFEFHVAAPK
ncbi:MAG: uncharacterized protein JWQ04_1847 [Pedosphaera sp.]|nr:uncharacterized protein [Pedosphaera sp.]